jgi:hypothetical protein
MLAGLVSAWNAQKMAARSPADLHSALTHDAEARASTPMLMAKFGRASVASLARYARPSAEALARRQEQNDPA